MAQYDIAYDKTAVYKSVYIQDYRKVPDKLKPELWQVLGFKNSSHFLRQHQITAKNYKRMLDFIRDSEGVSNNTVGDEAPYDHGQLVLYNKGLIAIICSKSFSSSYSNLQRLKIIHEQIEIQKRINRNK